MADAQIRAGDDLRLDLTVTNPDGSARDITGATGTFLVYDSPRHAATEDPVYEGELLVTGGTDGTCSAVLEGGSTVDSPFAVLYYRVRLVEDDDTETTLQTGRLVIEP